MEEAASGLQRSGSFGLAFGLVWKPFRPFIFFLLEADGQAQEA